LFYNMSVANPFFEKFLKSEGGQWGERNFFLKSFSLPTAIATAPSYPLTIETV